MNNIETSIERNLDLEDRIQAVNETMKDFSNGNLFPGIEETDILDDGSKTLGHGKSEWGDQALVNMATFLLKIGENKQIADVEIMNSARHINAAIEHNINRVPMSHEWNAVKILLSITRITTTMLENDRKKIVEAEKFAQYLATYSISRDYVSTYTPSLN